MKIDNVWKLLSLAMGVVLMPLAGWVWTINVEVAQLRNDVGDIEQNLDELKVKISDLDDASRVLIGVEKDVQHVREILDRIEGLITR